MKLLDIQKVGGLTALDVKIFFRAVAHKFAEFGDEANCEVDDVKDEIFDMVKPRDPMFITLSDLIACKVGDTVVGMLTDMNAFTAYDRRYDRRRAEHRDQRVHLHPQRAPAGPCSEANGGVYVHYIRAVGNVIVGRGDGDDLRRRAVRLPYSVHTA